MGSDFNKFQGMQKALIVSPDPQTARMLALALELEGLDADHEATLPESFPAGIDALLLDIVEGEHEVKEGAKGLSEIEGKRPKTVVILPQGYDRARASKHFSKADLIVTRPFHLTSLIKQTIDLITE